MLRINIDSIFLGDDSSLVANKDSSIVFDLSFGCFRKYIKSLLDAYNYVYPVIGKCINRCGGFSFPSSVNFRFDSRWYSGVVSNTYTYSYEFHLASPYYIYPSRKLNNLSKEPFIVGSCMIFNGYRPSLFLYDVEENRFVLQTGRAEFGNCLNFAPFPSHPDVYGIWNLMVFPISISKSSRSSYTSIDNVGETNFSLKNCGKVFGRFLFNYTSILYGANSVDIMLKDDKVYFSFLEKRLQNYNVNDNGAPFLSSTIYAHLTNYSIDENDESHLLSSSPATILHSYNESVSAFLHEKDAFVKLVSDNDGNVYSLIYEPVNKRFVICNTSNQTNTINNIGLSPLINAPVLGYSSVSSYVDGWYGIHNNIFYGCNVGFVNAFLDNINGQNLIVIHSINSPKIHDGYYSATTNKVRVGRAFVALAYLDINAGVIKKVSSFVFESGILLTSILKISDNTYLLALKDVNKKLSSFGLMKIDSSYNITVTSISKFDSEILGLFASKDGKVFIPFENEGFGVISDNSAIALSVSIEQAKILSYPTDVSFKVSALNYLGNSVYARVMAKILSPNATFKDGSTLKIFKCYPNEEYEGKITLKYGYKALMEFKILDTVI